MAERRGGRWGAASHPPTLQPNHSWAAGVGASLGAAEVSIEEAGAEP